MVTPLGCAAEYGQLSVVEFLLKQQVDCNKPSRREQGRKAATSPLYVAAQKGHSAIVECLLAVGAQTAWRDSEGNTALDVAAKKGHKAVVSLLLTSLSQPSEQARLFSASFLGQTSLLELILSRGVDVNVPFCGATPLFWAAQEGHREIAQALIRAGADI